MPNYTAFLSSGQVIAGLIDNETADRLRTVDFREPIAFLDIEGLVRFPAGVVTGLTVSPSNQLKEVRRDGETAYE